VGNLADNVWETSTTTGTGALSLAGAETGYRTFVAGHGNGSTVNYSLRHRTAAEWEIGEGIVTDATPDTLTRVTVYASSNGGSLVAFSAGTKDAFCSPPAAKLPLLHIANTFTADQTFNGRVFSAVGTAVFPSVSSSGQTNAGLFFTDDGIASILGLSAGGVEVMRLIGQNGRVSIGTASPSGAALLSINPVPSANWTISGANPSSLVTLANDATYDLAIGSGLVMLHVTADGLVTFVSSHGLTAIMNDLHTIGSVTLGTANKINFAYTAGTGKYRIETKRGASRDIYITTIMTRPQS